MQYSWAVLYRRYASGDFASLYAIEQVCFHPPHRFSRGYMRQLIGQADSATWIAENDGRMCGFGLVEWTRKREGTLAYVQTLEVLPESRAQGLGAELLRLLEHSARDAEAETISLHVSVENAVAIRLYERHGYCMSRREENYYGRDKPAHVYVKRLVI